MVCHSDEITLYIGFAAYALFVLKLRYNQNCHFLVQSHISDFQEPCVFECYAHCFKRRQRKRGLHYKCICTRNRYRSIVCIVIVYKVEMSQKSFMFVFENTACLSTFVKISLYNLEENIGSVY